MSFTEAIPEAQWGGKSLKMQDMLIINILTLYSKLLNIKNRMDESNAFGTNSKFPISFL